MDLDPALFHSLKIPLDKVILIEMASVMSSPTFLVELPQALLDLPELNDALPSKNPLHTNATLADASSAKKGVLLMTSLFQAACRRRQDYLEKKTFMKAFLDAFGPDDWAHILSKKVALPGLGQTASPPHSLAFRKDNPPSIGIIAHLAYSCHPHIMIDWTSALANRVIDLVLDKFALAGHNTDEPIGDSDITQQSSDQNIPTNPSSPRLEFPDSPLSSVPPSPRLAAEMKFLVDAEVATGRRAPDSLMEFAARIQAAATQENAGGRKRKASSDLFDNSAMGPSTTRRVMQSSLQVPGEQHHNKSARLLGESRASMGRPGISRPGSKPEKVAPFSLDSSPTPQAGPSRQRSNNSQRGAEGNRGRASQIPRPSSNRTAAGKGSGSGRSRGGKSKKDDR